MERVISVGGKGVQVMDGDYSEALYCLQTVMVLEKLLGERIPGNHFEAGRIVCGRKRQKQIEKKLLRNGTIEGIRPGRRGTPSSTIQQK